MRGPWQRPSSPLIQAIHVRPNAVFSGEFCLIAAKKTSVSARCDKACDASSQAAKGLFRTTDYFFTDYRRIAKYISAYLHHGDPTIAPSKQRKRISGRLNSHLNRAPRYVKTAGKQANFFSVGGRRGSDKESSRSQTYRWPVGGCA